MAADPVAIAVDRTELLKELRLREDRAGNTAPLLHAFGLALVRSTQKTFREGGRPRKWDASQRASETGGQTMRHKGMLSKSVAYEVTGNKVLVGTNLVYARIQQYGGRVTPKKAKALTIPVHPKAYGKRASDFPDLVYIPGQDKATGVVGRLVMVKGRKTHGGRAMSRKGVELTTYFVLRKSVRIQPRPFLQILPEDSRRFDRITERYLSTGQTGAGGEA